MTLVETVVIAIWIEQTYECPEMDSIFTIGEVTSSLNILKDFFLKYFSEVLTDSGERPPQFGEDHRKCG